MNRIHIRLIVDDVRVEKFKKLFPGPSKGDVANRVSVEKLRPMSFKLCKRRRLRKIQTGLTGDCENETGFQDEILGRKLIMEFSVKVRDSPVFIQNIPTSLNAGQYLPFPSEYQLSFSVCENAVGESPSIQIHCILSPLQKNTFHFCWNEVACIFLVLFQLLGRHFCLVSDFDVVPDDIKLLLKRKMFESHFPQKQRSSFE
jgi:hypothetical protein